MRNPEADEKKNVCFIVERNAIEGFGMIEGTYLTFRTLPDSAADNDVALLEWAEKRARLSHPHDPLQTQVREDNVERIHLLEQSGFKGSGNFFTAMERNTDLHGQEPVLPEGFSIMDGPGEEMFDEYVRMHRSAWGPGSTYSVEAHRRVTRHPGYAKELNPTVVTDGGRIAGSCICWPDTREQDWRDRTASGRIRLQEDGDSEGHYTGSSRQDVVVWHGKGPCPQFKLQYACRETLCLLRFQPTGQDSGL